MQTKKKHSKRFTRTKRSSSTRNKLKRNQIGGTRSEAISVEITPGNWQPARLYQKTAFRNFLAKYRGLNMNPDNVYQYEKDGIKFKVLGEIYIVREDGSRMRIKRVQLPEGTPDLDYDDEEPDGPGNKYYFVSADGSKYYFNNSINQEIEKKKLSSGDFLVGGKYRVIINAQEPQLGTLYYLYNGTTYSYPLYERRTAGWAVDAHGAYGGYPYTKVVKSVDE
jgi:hypothetical protein